MNPWMVRCGMLVAAFAVMAVAAEAVLRYQAHAWRRGIEEAHGWDPAQACNRADDRLVYRGIPGRCGANAQGFVDAERAFAKGPDVFRILVVGDSVALGHPLAYRASFAQLLEGMLAEGCRGKVIEVVVLAVVGYSAAQELELLREEGLRYAPDLVIWSYCLNDPAHPVRHDANGELGRYYHRPRLYVADFLEEKLFFVRERLRAHARSCPDEFHAFLHCVYAEDVAGVFRALGRWRVAASVPVVVAIHPLIERERDPEEYALRPLHRWLTGLAAENGLVALDVLAAYEGRAWQEVGVGYDGTWFDCYHPSPFGHRLAARHLGRELIERGLVPAECGAAAPAS